MGYVSFREGKNNDDLNDLLLFSPFFHLAHVQGSILGSGSVKTFNNNYMWIVNTPGFLKAPSSRKLELMGLLY